MLKDTPNPDEEAEAKLGQGGESEDEKEFNALFDGINLDEFEKTDEEKQRELEMAQAAAMAENVPVNPLPNDQQFQFANAPIRR